jgi:nucleoid DNA-binding protein
MSNNYTRRELATALAARLSVNVQTAKKYTETFVDILTECFAAGQKVELRNFGVFAVVTRKAKVGRNPKNPSAGVYEIPPKRVVRFKAGKSLDTRLNP